MGKLIKSNYKFLIFLAVFGLIGGYFSAVYSIQGINEELLNEAVAQVGSLEFLIAITTLQSLSYALIFGILGKYFATKVGLWRRITFEKEGIIAAIIVSLAGGVLLIYLDVFLFNNYLVAVAESYITKPTFEYIMAALTYGGVVEEIMMRLFLMSFVAFIIKKINGEDEISTKNLIISNVISSILFAAGHLPAMEQMMGLSSFTIFRCFLLNGGISLLFGRIYRKYGIQYSMLAHVGVHIISKLIWILFL